MSQPRSAIGACAATLALLLTGSACGQESAPTTPPASATTDATDDPMTDEPMADDSTTDDPMTPGPTAGEPMTDEPSEAAAAGGALDFTATTLGGATFEGATLAGKPVLLWFWAPWCPTCAGQAQHISELADTYEGQVNVVGVGGLDQAEAMRTFVADREVDNFVHLSDETGAVWQRFGITAQSTYVVLDADGTVVAQGVLSEDDLDQAVSDSLA